MRNLFTMLTVLLAAVSFSQTAMVKSEMVSETTTIEGFSMTLEVDSADEVNAAFNLKEIEEILNQIGDAQNFTFEIVCNTTNSTDSLTRKIAYKFIGTNNDRDAWLKKLEKMKSLVIAFYKDKH